MKNNRSQNGDQDWIAIYFVALLMAAFLLVIGAVGHGSLGSSADADEPVRSHVQGPSRSQAQAPTPAPSRRPIKPGLPGGGLRIFEDDKFLVAYYGTAGTGSLGVLGEAGPDRIMPRLRAAARPFERAGRRVQPVFELIVTVVHASPTRTGTYSTDIDRALVERYIRAAHRYGVLLLLDLQPGTAGFLPVAQRWEWALKDPWVGLALDPEWRMSRGGVPGKRIGSVDAVEVNRVSRWLDVLTARDGLPEKVFLLHQFRTDMIRNIGQVKPRQHLAEVQHIDGFGPPKAKMSTFRHVIRPRQFALGFKLFYDEDIPRMRPAQVLAIRPQVRFVSFQ